MSMLLAAERRGRGFLYQVTPALESGRLEFDVVDNPDGHALLAAARAAPCLGVDLGSGMDLGSGVRARVRLGRPDAPSSVWRQLVPGCRRFADVEEAEVSASAGWIVDAGGTRFYPVPDDRSVWARPLPLSAPRVRRDDGSTRTLSRAESRDIDRVAIQECGVPGICLMENAAMSAVTVALDMLKNDDDASGRKSVLVVAGGGNNGGDGLAMARGFDTLGIDVEVALFKPVRTLSGDALANFDLLENTPVAVREIGSHPEFLESMLQGRDLVVDALLGTGFTVSKGDALAPAFLEAVRLMNASRLPVLAVDIPSGLDGDSGLPAEDAVRAARTCTFAAVKKGLREASAKEYVGELFLADIGVRIPE